MEKSERARRGRGERGGNGVKKEREEREGRERGGNGVEKEREIDGRGGRDG